MIWNMCEGLWLLETRIRCWKFCKDYMILAMLKSHKNVFGYQNQRSSTIEIFIIPHFWSRLRNVVRKIMNINKRIEIPIKVWQIVIKFFCYTSFLFSINLYLYMTLIWCEEPAFQTLRFKKRYILIVNGVNY